MRLTRSSFLTFLATLPVAYAAPRYDDLPEPQHYRVDPYIRAAVALQSLDRETAISRLHDMAQDPHSMLSVIILCRMLFTWRHGSVYAFRAPYLGVPSFVSGTEDDWPLWPIALVDGVPFTIVWGYTIGGLPESDESYLHYCEANCDWTDFKYALRTDQQKQNALAKFTSSDKWKNVRMTLLTSGTSFEEFFSRHIQ
jgi:hypothetical protein